MHINTVSQHVSSLLHDYIHQPKTSQPDELTPVTAYAGGNFGLGEGLSGELKDTVALFGKISEEIRPVKIRMNPGKMRCTYAA